MSEYIRTLTGAPLAIGGAKRFPSCTAWRRAATISSQSASHCSTGVSLANVSGPRPRTVATSLSAARFSASARSATAIPAGRADRSDRNCVQADATVGRTFLLSMAVGSSRPENTIGPITHSDPMMPMNKSIRIVTRLLRARSAGSASGGAASVLTEICLPHLLAGGQLAGRPLQDNTSCLDNVGVVGQRQGRLGVLFDQQDRGALSLELAQRREDQVHHDGRQAHRRLIEHQQPGPA